MGETKQPLVRFYDLSGPKPWSPACWCTRYALNYKGIHYETVKLSYPAIRPKCEELFPSMEGLEATVPIIEILQLPYKALNDSTPIAKLLNERFTEKDGYKDLKGLDEIVEYDEVTVRRMGSAIGGWILNDVYEYSLDKTDGSREYFKRTREERLGCLMREIVEKKGGGEEKCLENLKQQWLPLKERMAKEDGTGEPTYLDLFDAAHFKWVEAASEEKAEKVMEMYGDDTFTKLLKKVEPYSFAG